MSAIIALRGNETHDAEQAPTHTQSAWDANCSSMLSGTSPEHEKGTVYATGIHVQRGVGGTMPTADAQDQRLHGDYLFVIFRLGCNVVLIVSPIRVMTGDRTGVQVVTRVPNMVNTHLRTTAREFAGINYAQV